MDFMDNIDGLELPPAPATTVRRRSRQRTSVQEARGVHAALAQEAFDVALLVAVSGSIVNAIVASRRPQLRTSMAAYLPSAPSLFPVAVGSAAAATALSTQTIQSMIAFYGLVAFARSATLGYSAKREPGGIAGPISMETLGEAWQAAAMQALGVLSILGFLDKTSPLYHEGRDNSAAMRVVEMLWSVTLGRSPCVRIDGAVIVPGWIERRSHLRREINTPATLLVNGEQQRVTVRDLSAGGLGIDGSSAVQAGDRVSVSLGSGVKFDGVAVWNRDGRVGVKLTNSLMSPISDD